MNQFLSPKPKFQSKQMDKEIDFQGWQVWYFQSHFCNEYSQEGVDGISVSEQTWKTTINLHGHNLCQNKFYPTKERNLPFKL